MKLNNGSQVAARPSRKPTVGSPGYFAESNETGAPSHPGQDWFNDIVDELTQAVAAAGVTYDPSKITNLKSAVEALRNATNLNAGTVHIDRLPAGTDGGIDAAKLEGQSGSYYRNIANMTGNVPPERLSGTYPISINGNASTASEATRAYRYESDVALIRSDFNSFYITNNDNGGGGARKGDGAAHRIWMDRSQGLMKIQAAAQGLVGTGIGWIDAFTINDDGSVNQLKSIEEKLFGIGRTPIDVTELREFNTEYINPHSYTIFVSVYMEGNAMQILLVDDVPFGKINTAAGVDVSICAPVPPGSRYEVTAVAGSITYWSEL